jgi:hypothetical protein
MAGDFSEKRVLFNPSWELAEYIPRRFESCRRTTPTSTLTLFVLPKQAKFDNHTQQLKPYQLSLASSQLFIRQSVDDSTKEEVVVPASWPV